MPEILDQAKKATPCVQRLLDSRLRPWVGSKKRQLPVQSVPGSSPIHRGPGTEVESGTLSSNSNSIRALLNTAENIATATQGKQLPLAINSSIADRIDSSPPESLIPEGRHPFASEGVLHNSGWNATASGQPEFRRDEKELRGSESQGSTHLENECGLVHFNSLKKTADPI